jgi:hypothetical protein
MKKVNFTEMKNGSKEDYERYRRREPLYINSVSIIKPSNKKLSYRSIIFNFYVPDSLNDLLERIGPIYDVKLLFEVIKELSLTHYKIIEQFLNREKSLLFFYDWNKGKVQPY